VTCELAHLDAAYVLGALSPSERIDFERHLSDCAACSAAVRELAGLPGLLARVPADVWSGEAAEPVPESLLPALIAEVHRQERRRWWAVGAVAAAAVVLSTLGAVVLTRAADRDDAVAGPSASATPQLAPSRPMQAIGDEPLAADLSMTGVAWGTRLDLVCEYAGGGAWSEGPDETFAMYVRTANGDQERVATWRAVPGKPMRLTAATATGVDDIVTVVVRNAGGKDVLELGS